MTTTNQISLLSVVSLLFSLLSICLFFFLPNLFLYSLCCISLFSNMIAFLLPALSFHSFCLPQTSLFLSLSSSIIRSFSVFLLFLQFHLSLPIVRGNNEYIAVYFLSISIGWIYFMFSFGLIQCICCLTCCMEP